MKFTQIGEYAVADNSKELIFDWAKQEKVFLYKLGYVFLVNEEKVENAVFTTIKLLQDEFQTIDGRFQERFINTFIKECLSQETKSAELIVGNDSLKQLFKLKATERYCVYLKYILNFRNDEVAQFLNLREDSVIDHLVGGFEQLVINSSEQNSKIPIHNLLYYHEGKLSFDQYKLVNDKLSQNEWYRELLEKLIGVMNELQLLGNDLMPSPYFLEPNKPLTEKQIKGKKRKQLFFTSVVSFIFLVGILISSIGVGELGMRWKVWTAETVGYGENVYVTAIDQDIEITVTQVAADDMQTIIFYEVSDIDDKYHYVTEFHSDRFEVLETDIWDGNARDIHSQPRTFLRYLSEDEISEGRLFLPPIKNDQETITIRFHQLEQMNKGLDLWDREARHFQDRELISGEWVLEVPIKKYEAKTINVDQTIKVEDHKVYFDVLEVRPTGTYLVYELEPLNGTEDEYHYQDLHFTKIEGDGKRYQPDYFLDRWRYESVSPNRWVRTFPFESIYYDQPNELQLFLGRLVVQHNVNEEVEIDIESLPMEIDFLDTKITFADVKLENPFAIVLKEEEDENRGYDSFHFDLHPDYYSFSWDGISRWGMSSEGIYVDSEGNRFSDYEEVLKSANIYDFYNMRYITTEQRMEFYFEDFNIDEIEDLNFPNKFMIHGYTTSKIIDEEIKINLSE